MKKTHLIQILSVFILALFVTACNKTITDPEQAVGSTAKIPPSLSKKIDYTKYKGGLPPHATVKDTIYGGLTAEGIVQPNAFEKGTRVVNGWAYRDEFKSVSGKALGIMAASGPVDWYTLYHTYGFKMIIAWDYSAFQAAVAAGFKPDSIMVGISKAQYLAGLDSYLSQFPFSVLRFYIDEPMHNSWVIDEVLDVASYIQQHKPTYTRLVLCDYDWDPSDYYNPILHQYSNVRMMCDHYRDQPIYGHARDYETNYADIFYGHMYANWISSLINYKTEFSDYADSFGELFGFQANSGYSDVWLYSEPDTQYPEMLSDYCAYAWQSGYLLRLAQNFQQYQTCQNPDSPVEEQIWLTQYTLWGSGWWTTY